MLSRNLLARTNQLTAVNRLVPSIAMSGRRHYATPDESKADRVKNITVFGAGLMGELQQLLGSISLNLIMTIRPGRLRNCPGCRAERLQGE
jgi:hypothetical protein